MLSLAALPDLQRLVEECDRHGYTCDSVTGMRISGQRVVYLLVVCKHKRCWSSTRTLVHSRMESAGLSE